MNYTKIVDMSHRYEKMYVIRPQFFIPMITILRNAALKNVQIRKELAAIKEQNIDITNFEEKMTDFKEGFLKNVDLASRKFQSAVDEIDKTILHLQKVRENLLASDRQLHIANKKVDNLKYSFLTYKNPTMQKMFKEQKGKREKGMLTMICRHCQRENPESVKYCIHCGKPLDEPE